MVAERIKGITPPHKRLKIDLKVVSETKYKCSCGDPSCAYHELAQSWETNITHWKKLPPGIEPLV